MGNNGALISVLPADFTNNIESLSCGKNVQYDFCYNLNDFCIGGVGESGAGTLKNNLEGHANWVTKISLSYYDDTERGAVTTFTGKDCSDLSGRFEAPYDHNKKAEYDVDEMYNHGHMSNDFVSSIAIPYGITADLFKDRNFTGDVLNLSGDRWTDENHTMKCINLSDQGFDKSVSSIKVYHSN